jgi:predicted CopG family antitoxin
MNAKTTIKVGKDIVLKLSKLKVHPRQSNEEVILKLIEGYNVKSK